MYIYILPIHKSTKLLTKRLTTNLLNVKRAVSLFTRQRQAAETLMKTGIVSSSPPIRVCVVFLVVTYTYTYIYICSNNKKDKQH